ncbi:MAG: PAS domain-containing protein [Bacteroidales bacterium]|nr:PAS domain-containing protein [Bacteroidales bacterium]
MNKSDKSDNKIINKPTYYVGIGASAGGLEALEVFFKNMPKNSNTAFIVVQHLSPDYKSMMVELISRRTEMETYQITDGIDVEANKIYLIPPKKNLSLYHGQLFLTEQIKVNNINLPIDIFFRSLAADQKKKAIGIILSGTGSDGTLGIKAIKEQGGLVMVQDFTNAKFDGMPKSALSTGLVDYVLNADQMGDALVKFISHPNVINQEKSIIDKNETDFVKILSLIRSNLSIDFSYYKPKTIVRRIERRISVNQLKDIEEYVQLLLNSKEECEILSREFLIGVTQFFRDIEAFEHLEKLVIPRLFENKKNSIRIWSVGCSTGEEAYSLAILCQEYMDKNNINIDLKVFATDLDKEAVRIAGMGIYSESIVADVPDEYLYKYFIKKHESYQINEKIRQMVIFANHNITADPPFSKIDMVTCRNLLIYFKPEVQQKVLNMFQYSLFNGGFMFLGSSESINGVASTFEVINSKWKIFKFIEGATPGVFNNFFSNYGKLKNMNISIPKIEPNLNNNVRYSPLNELYEEALTVVSPPGVIIDYENTIVHYLNDVHKYLNFPKGKPNYNFIELIDPQLTLIMSNIIFKSRKEKKEITINKFKYVNDEKVCFLNISAKQINLAKSKNEFVIITIVEEVNTKTENENISDYNFDDATATRIKELERELQYRDENLQTTIEELETSNEELQATNEELVSSNEELQSTNEELQSVNEELYTVNSQYQEKINELTELNNDINNLLKNTDIGTLFLDSKLIIRKFTNSISKTLNIMDIDLGRPLSHITTKCNYDNFYEDVNKVLNTLVVKEVELKSDNGEWFLMKIQPYRHPDNSIHGITVTQMSISNLKNARTENQKLKQIIDKASIGILISDKNGIIEYVNSEFTKISGYYPEDCISKKVNILNSNFHKREFFEHLWNTILSGKTWNGSIRNAKKSGEIYWENNSISAIKNSKGEIINFIAIKQDITQENLINEKLKIKKTIINQSNKISKSGSWTYNYNDDILIWSDEVYRIFDVEPQNFTPTFSNFLKLVHPDDVDLVNNNYKQAIENGLAYQLEHRIITPKNEIKTVIETSEQIIEQDGSVISIGVIMDITEQKIHENEQKMLINTLPVGFAYHKIIYDENNKPVDYEFVNANKIFCKLSKLDYNNIIGKTIKELTPDFDNAWIEKFAEVAATGKQLDFEQYLKTFKKNIKVKAYSPQKNYFAIIFEEKE